MAPVLEVRGLTTEFRVGRNWFPAISGISFSIDANETLAVVGESGSGKSVTALSIMRLLSSSGARIAAGEVRFEGRDLLKANEREMSLIRGNEIAMVFQEPMTSLNPMMKVGEQIAEVLRIHRGMTGAEARREALSLLDVVKVPDAKRRIDDYPHQFSGGMRQRVVIAIALACRPKVLLADEPTTALDVTVQAQVLSLLGELKKDYGMGILFITHNMGVVAQIADRVAVMYAGEIVETAPTDQLFAHPVHPYTEALLAAMPRVDKRSDDLRPIRGSVPGIAARPAGCHFRSRCDLAEDICIDHPPLVSLEQEETAARCFVRAPAEGCAA